MIPEGMLWNQAVLQPADPLNAGLLSLLVIGDNLVPTLVGTAFLIAADGNIATAVSAAHCFEQVRKILHPNALHHPSALPEFLPQPSDVDLTRVKAVHLKGEEVVMCDLKIAIWDSATDLAVFEVLAPDDDQKPFDTFFWVDDKVPKVGEQIAMIGYADMESVPNSSQSDKGKLARRLEVRIGRVEAIHSEGHNMLKAPCIETTIPVFFGMSGGVVARWPGTNSQIEPFAFISWAPEPQPLADRSQSGHSLASLLNAKKTILGEKKQTIEIQVNNIRVGRSHPEKRAQ